jgi:D-glycerate 3-kinase
MLGFRPSGALDESLSEIDLILPAYEHWYRCLDGFLQLVPQNYRHVLDWRVEAEEKMKASGRSGMSAERIRAYVQNFLPAYEAYLPGLEHFVPNSGQKLRIRLGKGREVLGIC